MKKKFFLMIALLAIGATSASAQTVWGLRLGVLSYTETVSVNNLSASVSAPGFELGPVFYYSFKNNLYINSGAMFGIMIPGGSASDSELSDYQTFSVDIPVYLGIKIPIGSRVVSLFGQAGTYFGYWFTSNEVVAELLQPFQAGLGAMVGVNVKRFKFELGYKYGLTNFTSTDNVASKLSSLFAGVSYVF